MKCVFNLILSDDRAVAESLFLLLMSQSDNSLL